VTKNNFFSKDHSSRQHFTTECASEICRFSPVAVHRGGCCKKSSLSHRRSSWFLQIGAGSRHHEQLHRKIVWLRAWPPSWHFSFFWTFQFPLFLELCQLLAASQPADPQVDSPTCIQHGNDCALVRTLGTMCMQRMELWPSLLAFIAT